MRTFFFKHTENGGAEKGEEGEGKAEKALTPLMWLLLFAVSDATDVNSGRVNYEKLKSRSEQTVPFVLQ